MTILVIDDDKILRQTIKTHLTLQEYEVIEAETAENALELLQHHDITLAIVDIKMKGMGGMGFLQKYRDISPATRAILLTGYPTLETAKIALQGGATALAEYYLEKPLNKTELLTVVEKVFTRLSVGRLSLDPRRAKIYLDNKPLAHVTLAQVQLLHIFCENPTQSFTYPDLALAIRGEEMPYKEAKATLGTQLKRLRIKLEEAAGLPVIISTYGQGFHWNPEFLK